VSFLNRLLKVGTMADSLSLYVPAMAFQKIISFLRLMLFWHILSKVQDGVQFGLWGIASLVFTIAAPIMTLGSHHGLVRYVSFYENRGRLTAFYRRSAWVILAVGLLVFLVAMFGSRIITALIIVPKSGGAVSFSDQWMICMLALGNALLLGLYHNTIGFMLGMRAYRLVSVVEVLFGILFTAIGLAALMVWPTGVAALWSHMASLGICLAVAIPLLHLGLTRLSGAAAADAAAPDPAKAVAMEQVAESDQAAAAPPLPSTDKVPASGMFRRIFVFGVVALVGNLLWHAATFTSYLLVHKQYGEAVGGKYQGFLRYAQPIVYVANTFWAVLFSHVARSWEGGGKPAAAFTLEVAYKVVVLVTMTLTVLVYVTMPFWIYLVPQGAREYAGVVAGLLMLFQAMVNLAIMTIWAKLREKPSIIAVAAFVGVLANAALALLWMPGNQAFAIAGAEAAAWAGGIGMFVGAGLVSIIYLLASRVRLQASTYFVMASPALLLLVLVFPACPGLVLAGVWSLCLLAGLTPWMFSHRQKQLISATTRRFLKMVLRGGSWR